MAPEAGIVFGDDLLERNVHHQKELDEGKIEGATKVLSTRVEQHAGMRFSVRDDRYASFDEQQVFAQLAPVHFDASTLELWGPLCNGGRLEAIARGGVFLRGINHIDQVVRNAAARLRSDLVGPDVQPAIDRG